MPFPKAGPRKGKSVRKRMKSQILIDTPVLNRMREARERKCSRDNKIKSAARKKLKSDCEEQPEKKRPKKDPVNSTALHLPSTSENTSSSKISDTCNRPKRAQKRRFSLAEALHAIQADSEGSE
jgi:hypothetical protein